MPHAKRLFLVPALCFVLGCSAATSPTRPVEARSGSLGVTPAGEPIRVLFIGNSLTYVNDLPGMVADLSRLAGDARPIETESVAFGGFALEDHLVQGDAPAAIQRGGWDIVVMQQGPSTLPESRVNLIEYTRQFAILIRKEGAVPALYGVWPEKARLYAFDDGIESYRQAAQAVHGLYFPAAMAWKAAWRRDAALPLYGPDDFHPSMLGTYAAACVIWAGIQHRSPVGLPTNFTIEETLVSLDANQARTVQLAAEEVTVTRPRATGTPTPDERVLGMVR